jgi:hypothetical protein
MLLQLRFPSLSPKGKGAFARRTVATGGATFLSEEGVQLSIDMSTSRDALRVITRSHCPPQGEGMGGNLRFNRCWKEPTANRDMVNASGGAMDGCYHNYGFLPLSRRGREPMLGGKLRREEHQ